MRTRSPQRESGSAYIITLLALVILSIMGLSLATITGTEMEVGANERGVTRVFYSADSGANTAVADALTRGAYAGRTFFLSNGTQTLTNGDVLRHGSQIDVSHFYPILWNPCNWCPVNENEAKFFRVNHAVSSVATEFSWAGNAATPPADAIVQSRKAIGKMIEFQPWWEPPPESLSVDPAELEKVSHAF